MCNTKQNRIAKLLKLTIFKNPLQHQTRLSCCILYGKTLAEFFRKSCALNH